jgi:hypothetical protein
MCERYLGPACVGILRFVGTVGAILPHISTYKSLEDRGVKITGSGPLYLLDGYSC